MYGAILGDMIGAPYEFDKGDKTKNFELFDKRKWVRYTDDSAMSLAIAKAVMNAGIYADEAVMKAEFVSCMQDIGNRYAQGEYGGRFAGWLASANPQPYGSFGNGSAMRVSAIGWFFETMERTREVARWSAEVTHNHPEGVKGAESVASAIYLARNGASKKEIKQYVIDNFGYDLSRTCDEIRPNYRHVESCQETVPEAITAFLEGEDFEDVIRTAVSLGGDCDTLTCIAGSIAEAFYGVPEAFKVECEKRLPQEFLDILSKFKEFALYNGGKRGEAARKVISASGSSANPYAPFGANRYRYTAEDRIEVFQDTMSWIEKDPELSASVMLAKQKTAVFYEDDYPIFNMSQAKDTVITVTGDRSYQAAMRLRKENPNAKIAVMNFANAFHAGGGVTKGSSAQEECLCRTSTLYPLLYRRTLRDSFYKHHHDLNTPKASDSLIYTEGVIICKTDEELPKRMQKEEWVTVDVITIAAPDLRDKSNVHAPLVNGGTYMNDAELFGYHVKRAIHLLTCAAAKGADILVLGAFGCGAFRNNPEVVAKAYKTALDVFPKVFKKIEFAVYCPPGGSVNYEAFSKVFGSVGAEDGTKGQMDNLMPEMTVMQKIELIHGSCADQDVDVVVNAANRYLAAGGGVCGVIFMKAGKELATACQKHKLPLKDGDAVITPAFGLSNAKAIIHAVGPDFGSSPKAFKELYEAYYNSLVVMKENGYHSISFPLISAGIFGGNLPSPAEESTKQCCRAYDKFVEKYPDYDVRVYLCAFSDKEYATAMKHLYFVPEGYDRWDVGGAGVCASTKPYNPKG